MSPELTLDILDGGQFETVDLPTALAWVNRVAAAVGVRSDSEALVIGVLASMVRTLTEALAASEAHREQAESRCENLQHSAAVGASKP